MPTEEWTRDQKRTVWDYYKTVWTSGEPTRKQGEEFGRIAQRFSFEEWLGAMQSYYENDPRPLSEQTFRPTPGMIAKLIRAPVLESWERDEEIEDPLDWATKPRPDFLPPKVAQ